MSTADLSEQKKTVADIWIEVQAEQKQFNRVIRYLTAALLVAAIAAGVAAYMSFTEFRNLRQNYKQQIDYSVAKSAVQNAEAEQERHAMRTELIALKAEKSQNRVFAKLPRQTDRALVATGQRDEKTLNELTSQALDFAKKSAAGDLRLNPSTSYLIESLLELNANYESGAIFTEDEMSFLETALADWQRPSEDEIRKMWTSLSGKPDDRIIRGYAVAGLAHYHYRQASDASPALDWNKGCRDATEKVEQARALGVVSISLNLAAGSCLRKNGDYESAFREFVEALRILENLMSTDDGYSREAMQDQIIKFRVDASHGAGTTLIPYAINLSGRSGAETIKLSQIYQIADQLPEGFNELKARISGADSILEVSEAFLIDAIAQRRKRNEGEVGEFGTLENLGYVYLAQGDWKKAIRLARQIDQRMARPWNLVVLAIALEEAGFEKSENYSRVINKISLFDRTEFNASEIRKLLSENQRLIFDQLLEKASTANSADQIREDWH